MVIFLCGWELKSHHPQQAHLELGESLGKNYCSLRGGKIDVGRTNNGVWYRWVIRKMYQKSQVRAVVTSDSKVAYNNEVLFWNAKHAHNRSVWHIWGCLHARTQTDRVAFQKIIVFIYSVFLALLDSLLCGLFSSCHEWGLPSSCGAWTYCGGVTCRRAQARRAHGLQELQHMSSVVAVPRLHSCTTRP